MISARMRLAIGAALVVLGGCTSDGPTGSNGTPGSIFKAGGDNQIANHGNSLPAHVRVLVRDSFGLRVGGASVHFTVSSGGGSVTPVDAITNDSGIAVTSWTLGAGTSSQTLTATVPGLPPLVFSASAILSSSAGFQVTLANVGPAFSPAVRQAFDSAIAFWQSVITGDVSDFAAHTIPVDQCANDQPYGPVDVDDILILAQFDSIDGPGQILGQASPCFIRNSNQLPISGVMRFDTADVSSLVAAGLLKFVIRHEMGHVLGFGTLWGTPVAGRSPLTCLQNETEEDVVKDTFFGCAAGLAAFDAIGGAAYTGGFKVPLENCTGAPPGCGPGTFNSHWRESVFRQELMTGYLNPGSNPVSRVTVGTLEDLGYVVDYAAAEAYTPAVPFHVSPRTAGPQNLVNLGADVMDRPIFVVDPSGRITAIARNR